MKLNTAKLQEMNKEEIEKVNGGVSPFDMYTIGSELWKLTKEYAKGPGPSMEMQYKHGMPGGKW
ncbi:hypothetical protein KFD70_23245 [Bacillus pfraonensis]|uniref:hypothetical protein n=1 Tax=Bacillus TaxID=1386 RepID=UPI003012FCD7